MIKGGYLMKKIGVLAAVLAMALLFVGVASAEMYVEGYIGAARGLQYEHGTSITEVPVSWQRRIYQVRPCTYCRNTRWLR